MGARPMGVAPHWDSLGRNRGMNGSVRGAGRTTPVTFQRRIGHVAPRADVRICESLQSQDVVFRVRESIHACKHFSFPHFEAESRTLTFCQQTAHNLPVKMSGYSWVKKQEPRRHPCHESAN